MAALVLDRTKQMTHGLNEMARHCYGYGRWAAPYWFIGPEQGMGRSENDDLTRRVEVWCALGKHELDDCRKFHQRIGEDKWHRTRPRLQSTWRPLILLLMTYLDRPADNERLRNYQRDEWGTLNGETCVIELCGIPAHSSIVKRNRECFREERIQEIRQ